MKRSFVEALLTVTMIIMMSTAGYAFTAPHNFSCDNCHGKFSGTLDGTKREVSANNSCSACHSSIGEANRKPVDSDAMSNYFGSASGQPLTGSRSTHTWGAYSAPGHPYNPRAMVHEPTNPILNTGYNPVTFYGSVLCIRCHDSKGNNSNTRFLRATNVNDAICLDCHRARNTTTHTTGSHPVAYRAYSLVYKYKGLYNGVYRDNTTAFRKIPLSPNPNNPTAQLGNYMTAPNKGKIVCSTCHAPHYADSSSATLGNRSTANGFAQDDPSKGLKGQLQNSKGQLLRTDPLGATASAINVCSSCHKETANLNHNGRGQNIQCNHCHGAHVDYTGDGSLPNLYLVRRDFSNMSTAKLKLVANVKVIYNTATSLRFKRADNKGICQVCHPTLPAGVAIHQLPDSRAKDCMDCHNHKNGFSFGSCATCHGQPPMTSSVGGPDGKASAAYTLDESLTPHATHANKAYYEYSCKNCHYDGTRQDSHNTSTPTFQSVFVETAGSVGEIATGVKNISSDYNPTTRRCSNVYCHSNGKPRGGIAMKSYTTPSWEYGRNKIFNTAAECTNCHGSGSTLTTNAHKKHVVDNEINCSVCHAATVNNATAITDRTKHANGAKDVQFATRPTNFFGVFSSSWNATAGTCNTSCHSDGTGKPAVTTPKWTDTATGACGTCHAQPPTSSLHFQHFTTPAGPRLGTTSAVCINCHTHPGGGLTHANGQVDLKSGPPEYPNNSCAPCHPGTTSPVWMLGAKVTCESCHAGATASVVRNPFGTYTAPLKSLNSSVGHGQYAMASTCTTKCHSASAPHIGAGPDEKRLAPLSGNALCNDCHKPSVMGIYSATRANLPVHGGAVDKFSKYTSALSLANVASTRSDACAGCHDTHGTTNKMSLRTVINGQAVMPLTNLSTAFIAKVKTNGKYNGFCQVCHSKAQYFSNWTAPEIAHQGSAGKNCLMCHKHKDKDGHFAFYPGGGGGCGGCHGYPPASSTVMSQARLNNYTYAKIETTSGAGGAHTVAGHIPKNAKQIDGWANCDSCHSNKDATHMGGGLPVKPSFVDVIVDPTKYKFNNNSTIKYNVKNCSNASCHFKKSPNWTTGL